MTVYTPTAYRPLPSLLTSLRRAGWGPLAGNEYKGVRAALDALCARLPHKSAQGFVTIAQVADTAAYTERWTRECMHVLEDLGVIVEWRRGGVIDRKPTPSWLRIDKGRLVELIGLARPALEAVLAARRTATAARLAGLKSMLRARSRRSDLPEVGSDLLTLAGEAFTPNPVHNPQTATRDTLQETEPLPDDELMTRDDALAMIRAALR